VTTKGARHRYEGLHARNHCGESDLPRTGGSMWPEGWPTYSLPVAHQRQKSRVALTTSSPSRCAATTRLARGDTRGAASLPFIAADAWNPCQPLSHTASQARPRPQYPALAL